MKTMKKLASIALALILALALAAPAFAAGEGAITVTNPAPKQTYKVYRVFDLESYGTGENAPHSYKVNDKWRAFVTSEAVKDVFVTIDDQGYITWIDDADPAAFAKLALAYAENDDGDNINDITPDAAPITAGEAAEPTEEEPDPRAAAITFTGLDLGYYLISSTRGTLCALDTTNTAASVTEKNVKPTVEKKAVELPDRIGDSVDYEVTVHAKKGAEGYVVHDTMSAGLSFNNDVVVKVGETVVADTNYTVNTETTDDCTFEVIFEQAYLNTLTDETTDIVISYSATVTADAVVVDKVNNTAKLTFNNESTPEETLPDPVDVELYKFDLVKTDKDDKLLSGATFELRRGDSETAMQLVKVEENVYRPVAKDKDGNITDDPANIVTTVTTDATGKITFKGLGLGTYYLHETAAPDGYNKLKEDREVKIEAPVKDADGNITSGGSIEAKYTDGVYETGTGVQVINKTGLELPDTGGIGTTIFYIVGGMMVLGAGILLVTKKRMSGEEE